MVRETKLYDILGVSPGASEQEIRRAYKQKAVQMHPDKGGDEEAFKEVCHAHSVLSDSEKRRRYDLGGSDAVSSDAGGGGGGGGMADMFSAMFGGGGGGGPRAQPKPRDLVHTLELPLEHLYRGKAVKLAITRDRNCEGCKGSGSCRPGANIRCRACNGQGQRTVVQQIAPGFLSQATVPCSQCRGRGTDLDEKDKCKDCNGRQVVEKRDVFTVNVDQGTRDGDQHRFAGAGDNVPSVAQAGDVVIVIKEKKHPVFKRLGKHLLVEQTLTLADALCGFEFIIPHLDGRHVVVKSTPGQVIKPGIYSVHHEGMPVKGSGGFDKGDLLIKTTVVFPPVVPAATKAAIREVLGPLKETAHPASHADFYETNMRETTIKMEDLAGPADESDDDDDAPRGGGAQCTAA